MEEVCVRAESRSYPVLIGEGALEAWLPRLVSKRAPGQVVVVSHPVVVSLHGGLLDAIMREAGHEEWQNRCFVFPEGEEHKRPSTVCAFHELLLAWGVNRSGLILAFGGGVVGDMAGFAAATYMRGVDFIQIPTTLMAMVDSSIGGKVGVDMPSVKNAVGTFHQPVAVISDTEMLSTLPRRDLVSGLAEVIKYGLLYDADILTLKGGWEGWARITEWEREEIIAKCVRLKAAVVEKDEKDLSGERAILNYGHTFGHALESATGYSFFRHGEAVAVGMIMAARLAEKSGVAETALLELHIDRLYPLLEEVPIRHDIDAEAVLCAMYTDKKRDSSMKYVLLESPQQPLLASGIKDEMVIEAIRETLNELQGRCCR